MILFFLLRECAQSFSYPFFPAPSPSRVSFFRGRKLQRHARMSTAKSIFFFSHSSSRTFPVPTLPLCLTREIALDPHSAGANVCPLVRRLISREDSMSRSLHASPSFFPILVSSSLFLPDHEHPLSEFGLKTSLFPVILRLSRPILPSEDFCLRSFCLSAPPPFLQSLPPRRCIGDVPNSTSDRSITRRS